jgi:hypothetical protein
MLDALSLSFGVSNFRRNKVVKKVQFFEKYFSHRPPDNNQHYFLLFFSIEKELKIDTLKQGSQTRG